MVKTREDGISVMWEPNDVLLFCDLCITEMELGNITLTHLSKEGLNNVIINITLIHLSKEGWNNVIINFQQRTGKIYLCAQMEKKWDQLRKDWKIWKKLKHGATIVGWDATKRTIDASDDWWKERLKVVPAAKKFRYAGISPELERKLFLIFSEVHVLGKHAWAPISRADSSSPENVVISEHDEERIENLSTPTSTSDDQRDHMRSIFMTGSSSQRSKSRVGIGRHGGFRKNRIGRYHIDRLIESNIRVGEALLQPPKLPDRLFTIHEAIEELEKHEEIRADLVLYDFATIFLMDNKNREIFLSLPSSKKVWWLRNRQCTSMQFGVVKS